jgi:hypothetical protein
MSASEKLLSAVRKGELDGCRGIYAGSMKCVKVIVASVIVASENAVSSFALTAVRREA